MQPHIHIAQHVAGHNHGFIIGHQQFDALAFGNGAHHLGDFRLCRGEIILPQLSVGRKRRPGGGVGSPFCRLSRRHVVPTLPLAIAHSYLALQSRG